MKPAACAVGRIGPGPAWLGFAPTLDDGYAMVVGAAAGVTRSLPSSADDLLVLAIAYFGEALPEPPDELAATHGDIASLVRHLSAAETDPSRATLLAEAVDAIDDGYAEDAVIARLSAVLPPSAGDDPVARLVRRAERVL